MNLEIATGTKGIPIVNAALFGATIDLVRPHTRFYIQTEVLLSQQVLHDPFIAEFKQLQRKWKRETQHISSPTDKYLNRSYARIIGLGWPAVRAILQTMQRQPDDWFYALRAITGDNPVTNQIAGDVKKMTEAWVAWGRKRGLT